MKTTTTTTTTTHQLKTWPAFFRAVIRGDKTFEIRENDRGFRVGDTLLLREWDPETMDYTGKAWRGKVVYMTDFAQQPGFVVMGIKPTDGFLIETGPQRKQATTTAIREQ